MRGRLTRTALLLGTSVLAAMLLLALSEVALRVFGVADGPPAYDPFAGFSARIPIFEPYEREDGEPAFRIASARLQNGDAAPSPAHVFAARKRPGAFRAFVVGGSSAAGFPYPPEYGFAAVVERELRASLPEMTIEVVNAALPGYASRRVLIITREIAAYEPDLVIIYSGHNEWAEQSFHRRFIEMDPRIFRLREFLLTTRLSNLVSRLSRPPSASESRKAANALAFEQGQMFRVLGKRGSGEAYATPEEIAERDAHYQANVEEMVRTARAAGAAVVLVGLAQNFADWEPGASEHDGALDRTDQRKWYALMQAGSEAAAQGDCVGAVLAWKSALEVDPRYALLHYRVAGCYRALREFDLAREHYRLASDLDRVPHGAPSAYNEFLRALAEREGLVFVDADAALTRASADGLVGAEFFNEFVHPNLLAHQVIGHAIADALREAAIPRPAVEWAPHGPTEAMPAELYAANPDLEVREHLSWRAVCQVSRRQRCVEEQERALAELGVESPRDR